MAARVEVAGKQRPVVAALEGLIGMNDFVMLAAGPIAGSLR